MEKLLRKEATRADIEDFKNWLSDKSGEYNPGDPGNCLVCRFMKDRGFKNPQFYRTDVVLYVHGPGDKVGAVLPKTIAEIAYGKNNMSLEKDYEFTYEAAHKRAETVLRLMK